MVNQLNDNKFRFVDLAFQFNKYRAFIQPTQRSGLFEEKVLVVLLRLQSWKYLIPISISCNDIFISHSEIA